MLFHDGTGFCLFYKRLDRGLFRLLAPVDPSSPSMSLEESALEFGEESASA